jgi:hypothetical protein
MSTVQAAQRRDLNRVPINGSTQFYTHKLVTFDGVTVGAVAAINIFQVFGVVKIALILPECKLDLTSGGAATIGLGATGNGQFFIAPTGFNNLDNGSIWTSDTTYSTLGADLNNTAGVKDHIINGGTAGTKNILLDVLVAAITAGQLDVHCFWTPVSGDGRVVAL